MNSFFKLLVIGAVLFVSCCQQQPTQEPRTSIVQLPIDNIHVDILKSDNPVLELKDYSSTTLIINSNSAESTTIIPVNVELTINIIGDVNGDEIVNVLDIVLLVNLVLTGAEYNEQSDINNDGIINILDVVQLVNIVLNS